MLGAPEIFLSPGGVSGWAVGVADPAPVRAFLPAAVGFTLACALFTKAWSLVWMLVQSVVALPGVAGPWGTSLGIAASKVEKSSPNSSISSAELQRLMGFARCCCGLLLGLRSILVPSGG